MTPREEELVARTLLERPELVGRIWKERRWSELAALVRFARRDVPLDLARTDPALFRTLRQGITDFWFNGGALFSAESLDRLARQDGGPSGESRK